MGVEAVDFFVNVGFLGDQDNFLFNSCRFYLKLQVYELGFDALGLGGKDCGQVASDVGNDGADRFEPVFGQLFELGPFPFALFLQGFERLGEQGEGFFLD